MQKNDRLFQLLNQLDYDELVCLMEKGLGKSNLINKKMKYYQLVDMISKTLRRTASYNFVNAFRLEHEYPYKQILIDVANKLQGYRTNYLLGDKHTEEEIEEKIISLFEKRTRIWWAELKSLEKKKIIDEINEMIDADIVHLVNRKALIKARMTKEVMDTIVAKGVVVGLVMVSAGGLLGFMGLSVLDKYGWKIITNLVGWVTGVKIFMTTGMPFFTIVGALGVGSTIWVGSTIVFINGPDYKRTIPTIIMLLAKVHGESVRLLDHE